MPDGKPWSVAFAGTGDTSEENVKALLDNWLPQSLEHVTVPDRIRRTHKGLNRVKDWLDEEIGESEISTAEVDQLCKVLDEHREGGCEVYLVYIPAEEWDEDAIESKVARACIVNGIPVKDLTAGLDDFEPPEPPAEQPAPRQRGKARRAAAEEVPADAPGDAQEPAEATASEDTPAPQEAAETLQAAQVGGVTVNLSAGTIQALLALAGSLAEDIKASVVAGLPDSAKPKVTTYPFWVNEDGEYRPRNVRGRPRAGEQKADLTAAEVEKLGLDLPQ
jgi:hypothetical protein